MKKTFYWALTALALLPGVAERAAAQATAETDASAETSVLSDEPSAGAADAADSAQDSVSETATGQNDAQPAEPADQPAAAAEASGAATADAAAPDATNPSAPPVPQPDAAADVNASGDATTDAASPDVKENPTADVSGAAAGEANLAAQRNQANVNAGVQFGAPTERGLTLNRVANDSFLYGSGLRQGDVLVSYGGRPIRSQADFSRWAVYQPGQRVPVVVWRDGREETIFITYHRHAGQPMQRQAAYAPQSGAYLGVTFDAQSTQGAVVRSVAPGSPAENAGIMPGHVIVGVNDRRVSTYQDVIDTLATVQPGQEIDLVVVHRLSLTARPGQAVGVAPANVRVGASAITQSPPAGVPAAAVPAARVEAGAVARPGDADRDGRVLDGDGRIGPRDRAGRR